jgi:carboxymethylenebutenolidase
MSEQPKITQEMIKLYDDYTHLTLDRRDFMEKLTRLAGSTAAAAAILPVLSNNYAHAEVVPEADPRITTETVTFAGASGSVSAYLARPATAPGPLPAVVVIHENRGLNPHIKDITRRLAVDGFLTLGVDFLSPKGGTPADEDAARALFGELDRAATIGDAVAAAGYLRAHEASNGKVGAIGFCWGGGMVNQLAAADPELDAAVVFYGSQADAAAASRIRAEMQFHYAGLDERINAGRAAYETALTAAGVTFESFLYEGANHAFNNDTNAARYDAAAAELAWSRVITFFRETLA